MSGRPGSPTRQLDEDGTGAVDLTDEPIQLSHRDPASRPDPPSRRPRPPSTDRPGRRRSPWAWPGPAAPGHGRLAGGAAEGRPAERPGPGRRADPGRLRSGPAAPPTTCARARRGHRPGRQLRHRLTGPGGRDPAAVLLFGGTDAAVAAGTRPGQPLRPDGRRDRPGGRPLHEVPTPARWAAHEVRHHQRGRRYSRDLRLGGPRQRRDGHVPQPLRRRRRRPVPSDPRAANPRRRDPPPSRKGRGVDSRRGPSSWHTATGGDSGGGYANQGHPLDRGGPH